MADLKRLFATPTLAFLPTLLTSHAIVHNMGRVLICIHFPCIDILQQTSLHTDMIATLSQCHLQITVNDVMLLQTQNLGQSDQPLF